jgi:hypothetical protein
MADETKTESAGEAAPYEDHEFFPNLDEVVAKHYAPEEAAEPDVEADAVEDDGSEAGEEEEEDADGDGESDSGELDEAGETDAEEVGEDAGDAEAGGETPGEQEPSLTERQLAALSRKEQSLLQREQALREQEARYQRLRQDPHAALTELGLSPGDVAAKLLYKELGEDAPAELQAKFEQQSLRAEVEALKQKIEGKKDPAPDSEGVAYQARLEALDNELGSVVKDIPADMPFLKALAEDDFTQAYETVCEVAANAIRGGQWPSARDVARRLEDALRSDWERFSKVAGKDTASTTDSTKGTRKRKKTTKVPTEAETTRKPKRISLEDEDDPYSDKFRARGEAILKSYMK